MQDCNISFKGLVSGKLIYQVGNEYRTRYTPPAYMCALGDSRFIKRINSLVKKGKSDLFDVKQNTIQGEKVLTFEISRKNFLKTSSLFERYFNWLRAEDRHKKVLKNKNITNFIYQIPKQDMKKLVKRGLYTDYNHWSDGLDTILTSWTDMFVKRNIKRLRKNMMQIFTGENEKNWVNDYFDGIIKK